MSLFQIWIESDRARVAVDSIGNGRGTYSGKFEISKLVPLAHAGVVVAYRGSDVAFLQVFAQLFLTTGNGHYDEIIEAMPIRCLHAHSQWPQGRADLSSQCQIALVGFSARLGRMAANVFPVDLATGDAQPREVAAPAVAAPGFASIPNLSTDAGMHELASRQVAWMAKNAPNDKTGGRLLVADVELGKITIRDLGTIGGIQAQGETI